MTSAGLDRLATVGPFFAVEAEATGPGWHRFSTLLDPATDDLRSAVAAARSTLIAMSGAPDVDERVPPSLWLMGWSARLLSIWLGAAVLLDLIPGAAPTAVHWRTSEGQPVPLALPDPAYAVVDPASATAVAQQVYDTCVRGLVEPLLDRIADTWSLSEHVLWGNVASSVAGTTAVLARQVPERSGHARAVAEALLSTERLAGRGDYSPNGFVRRSCCLCYRVPGAGLCADCVLVRR